MKASELIKGLLELIVEHGDLEVVNHFEDPIIDLLYVNDEEEPGQ